MAYRFAKGLGLDALTQRIMGEAAVTRLKDSPRPSFLCGAGRNGEPLIAIRQPNGDVLIRLARLDETVTEVGIERYPDHYKWSAG
jgi:hypothetical protein